MDFLHQVFTRDRVARILAGLADLGFYAALLAVCGLLTGRPDFRAVGDSFRAVSAFTGPRAELQELALESALLFQRAFAFSLMVLFLYELLTALLLGGRTPGKLLLGLRVVPLHHAENRLLTAWKLAVRGGVKCLSLYLFQGFPFLISVLYLFADGDNRAGHDRAARLRVVRAQSALTRQTAKEVAL